MLPYKTRYKEYCLVISHGIIKTMLNDYIKEHKAELPKTFEITGIGQSYDENKEKEGYLYFSIDETEEYYPCDDNTKPEHVNIFQFINIFTK